MAQCLLAVDFGANPVGTTKQFQTAWIPAKFATKNHLVRLPHDPRVWQVIEIVTFQAADYVQERESDYRYQREASDV